MNDVCVKRNLGKRGALPPVKAWRRVYGRQFVVTAKTKKRAAELVQESLYRFNVYWIVYDGDWCYPPEEAVWVKKDDGSFGKAEPEVK